MAQDNNINDQDKYAHYLSCRGKMEDINRYCTKVFYFVLLSSVFMSLLTLFGVRLRIISLIPSLFGEAYDVFPMMVQFLILAGMVVLSMLGFGRRKICNIILFGIYLFMLLSTLFYKQGSINLLYDTFSGIIGSAGTGVCFHSILTYFDYQKLSEMEGFPHFSERLSEQIENSSYKSQHDRKCYSTDSSMPKPDGFMESVAPPAADRFEQLNSMPELVPFEPPVTDTPKLDVYTEKTCRISESPIKTA